jgi:N-acetylgalactosamine kinase
MIKKCSQISNDLFNNHSILKKHVGLLKCIREVFQGEDDILFFKVPGRVNLIGEHVDYNNGPVLPCAIDREVVLSIKPNSNGLIRIMNVNPVYEEVSFYVHDDIIPDEKGNWGNYIKAGVKGILDQVIKSSHMSSESLNGFEGIISSTVPQAAGLSSSSTLVVGAVLAFESVNNLKLNKLEIAEICADAEHFVGTAGGGMDHAAILLGEKDSFLKIEFNPLSAEPISAPQDIEMVLFHSLIEAEKSSYAREAYNRRVLECNFARDLFNQFIMSIKSISKKHINYIGDIKPAYYTIEPVQLDHIISEFLESLPEKYSLEDLLRQLDISKTDMADRYRHVLRGSNLQEIPGGYKLKSRFRHVYSECKRVNQAASCLISSEKTKLGNLLDLSHKSLSEDYEVSTPEVDSIVNLLKINGAYGARMIGAGFGGMILALTDKVHANELIGKMQKVFYSEKSIKEYPEYIIRCNPADGAGLFQI